MSIPDPAPGGVLRICWASSFEPYQKRVRDEVEPPVKSGKSKRKRSKT